jgi:hypothetical protein
MTDILYCTVETGQSSTVHIRIPVSPSRIALYRIISHHIASYSYPMAVAPSPTRSLPRGYSAASMRRCWGRRTVRSTCLQLLFSDPLALWSLESGQVGVVLRYGVQWYSGTVVLYCIVTNCIMEASQLGAPESRNGSCGAVRVRGRHQGEEPNDRF